MTYERSVSGLSSAEPGAHRAEYVETRNAMAACPNYSLVAEALRKDRRQAKDACRDEASALLGSSQLNAWHGTRRLVMLGVANLLEGGCIEGISEK